MGKDHKKKVQQIISLGFTQEQAVNALAIHSGSEDLAIEYLLSTCGLQPTPGRQPNSGQNNKKNKGGIMQSIDDENYDEDALMKIALNESMITSARKNQVMSSSNLEITNQQSSWGSKQGEQQESTTEEFFAKFEPINAQDRQRNDRDPVGLKNIGNTCYFNSLIQSYFYLPQFTAKILSAYQQEKNEIKMKDGGEEMMKKRNSQAKSLVDNLGKLFAQMIMANRKYVDPTNVLKSLTDDFGNQVHVGEQRDLGEFNLNFLERIEEGLGERTQEQADSIQIIDDLSQTSMLMKQMSFHNNGFNILDVSSDGINAGLDLLKENGDFEEFKQESKPQTRAVTPIVNKPGSKTSPKIQKESTQNSGVTTMKQIFFGSKIEELKLLYKEQPIIIDGSDSPVTPLMQRPTKHKLSTRKEKLGPIILDLNKNHRLYESWDEAFQDEVQDFYVPESLNKPGVQSKCFQESWILDRPDTLFFNLNRVRYDAATQHTVKCHDYFTFDKVIYADMFLYKNQERANRMREDIEHMKLKVKTVNEKIRTLESYGNTSHVSLLQQLKNCELFLSKQDQESADIQIVLKVLKDQQTKTSIKVAELEIQLKTLTDQLDTAFIQQKECPYYLHSIVVHDGYYAESGHYFSFVYDRAEKIWWRFNDHTATVETEAIVFQESFGGKESNSKCAYSLIYVSQKFEQQLSQMPFKTYSFSAEFNNLLSPALKKHVHTANISFDKELLDYQVEKLSKNIIEKLKSRTETLKQLTQSSGQTLVSANLISFPAFLSSMNKAALCRWFLLNDCVREEHPAGMSLSALSQDDCVFMALANKYFSNQFLLMIESDSKLTEVLFQSFKQNSKNCAMSTFIMLNLTHNQISNWRQAIEVYLYFKSNRETTIQKENNQTQAQIQMAFDACRIFIIECLLKANQQIFDSNLEEALQYGTIAAILSVLILESSDPHFKQALLSLQRTNKLAKKLPTYNKDFEKRFSDLLSKIKKGNLSKEEKLAPSLPLILEQELSTYESLSIDQNQWNEDGWKPESLAFRYFNILQMYKAKYHQAFEMHCEILNRKGPYNEDELQAFEIKEMGFDLSKKK